MNTALSVGELSEADVSAHVAGVVQYAFSDDMLERIRSEQANDPECASLLEACMQGTQVWLKDRGAEGTVLRPSKTPTSYWVQTEGKPVRRNRCHLFLLPHGGETSPVRMEQHPRNSEPTDATDKDIVATKSSDIKEPRS
ncbi:hypothetical protein MRX96_047033 [Rhipicephalus microplus]